MIRLTMWWTILWAWGMANHVFLIPILMLLIWLQKGRQIIGPLIVGSIIVAL